LTVGGHTPDVGRDTMSGAQMTNLQGALYRYGAYLALLSEVPPPWE
jgi:hypothetical protein